jgi:DNA-directed RNA polymerase subunit L
MEVKIIEKTADTMRFEVHGADHALMNVMREKLSEDKNVEFSTYSEPHPLFEGFVITIKSKDPEASAKKALAAMKADVKEVIATYKSAK